ncbi:serine/threonine-protein kinase [Nocardia terpenica]|uniref:non-specific serine/threonine protein kinase n=1 Tax=Nocardia terpenica TaxID=455432 RepID=A0A164I9A9_9NOCA|nr:serine/threonine-protein kinase [Nocardia terpenica]KZM69219.1 serine/threonine protein kinase [Nocardia terpenica]NQE87653.1 serine/threonine protein kinase [Nocardia terpenica]
MALSPGTIVGGYRIVRVLGAGGMGTVYLAKHPSLPRMDALKVLSPELSRDREFRGRFEREANLAAGLDHPNIVAVHNRGEEHGQLWIAMQYVDGTDAAAEVARSPHSMTPSRALRIITEVGKGLDHAHRKGLLHRDIKPANFLLSSGQGEDQRVLLTDFGVAKSTDDSTELTQTGSFLATIAYASPEQLAGYPLDHRSDIYSLACSFYKLLTGQNPYPTTQPAMVVMGHLHEPPPRPAATRPDLPPALDHVFARAMAKKPADRFDSCREFTDAAAAAFTSGDIPPGPRRTGPKRAALAVGALAVVGAVTAGGLLWADRNTSTTHSGAPNTSETTAALPKKATSVAQARQEHPAFAGKSLVLADVSNGDSPVSPNVSIYLKPGPQTDFLENLGFVYDPTETRQGQEISPRPLDGGALYSTFTNISDSYILVTRSDSRAGGGGQLGLPAQITSAHATVIVVDDPATVAAIRNWTETSGETLLDKLVPLLATFVK